ncbi:MAG TPA: carbon storage regulator [Gemmatimonadales bacterium]|nr:carbon storage regulator [Gemmatimonadales bacterium]
MLVLNRRVGEAIVIDGGIRVVVLQCDRRSVRLGIEAPGETGIFREELVHGQPAAQPGAADQ